jgi:hypothetical protein
MMELTSKFWIAEGTPTSLSSKHINAAAILILFTFLVMLFVRTGVVPIASGGDDVWFSESAYWLLKDGQLRRPIHMNNMSEYRDFLPPIPALFQAMSFSILGIDQLSMAISPSVAIAIIIVFGLIAEKGGSISKRAVA